MTERKIEDGKEVVIEGKEKLKEQKELLSTIVDAINKEESQVERNSLSY